MFSYSFVEKRCGLLVTATGCHLIERRDLFTWLDQKMVQHLTTSLTQMKVSEYFVKHDLL